VEDVTALDTRGEFDPRLKGGEGARYRDEDARDRGRDPELALVEPVDRTTRREALGKKGTLAAGKFDDDLSIDRVGRAHVRPGQKELTSRTWSQVDSVHVSEVRAVPRL